MAKMNILDQAIDDMKKEILLKEQELNPLRDRILAKENEVYSLRTKIIALEKARRVINGEPEEVIPNGNKRGIAKREPATVTENPYGGFDPQRLEGKTVRDASIELARAAGGLLVCRYAGQMLHKAGIVRSAIVGNSSSYGMAAQSAEFTKSAPGQFRLHERYMAAGS